jgi:hypothetical protein
MRIEGLKIEGMRIEGSLRIESTRIECMRVKEILEEHDKFESQLNDSHNTTIFILQDLVWRKMASLRLVTRINCFHITIIFILLFSISFATKKVF